MAPWRNHAASLGYLKVLALAVVLHALPAAAIERGQPAPDFTLTDAQSQPVQLSALRGKAVYVDFWASWCAPCRRSFPWMNAMQEKYGPNGLVVVGINVDQRRADADKFLAQTPAKFSIAFDAQGATPKAYSIKGMPSSVLVDPKGQVVAVHAGFRDEDRDELEARIRSALPQR